MMQEHRTGQTTDNELSPIKRALLEVREMRQKLDAFERAATEPVAIVGMGCRVPGGDSPAGLWSLLCNGVDAIREIPADRWPVDAFYDQDPAAPGRMSTRWGGFIDHIDQFDAGLFGISPREAMAMDPQQRLLLEVAWEALEHAGQAPDGLRGAAAGIFMGISSFDYVHLAMSAPADALDSYLAQGIAHSAASGRLAYVLGTQGPAVSLDTACSSSLMAVHLAVQSLRRGECRLALAGGVNAILLPTFMVGFSKSQMMAADGRCKVFDARADGFVRGEGCGVVVLKRLGDALADRDDVWAVIRGSAVNQDGRSSGMTAPNGPAQEAVLRAALADARVEPGQVGYVEAHGTGTALGDPIEVQALGAVFGRGRPQGSPLRIGSLKTNIGHLEAAAGVTGVIKTALALRHGEIPPSLHFDAPNPFIAWADLPVEVAGTRLPFDDIDGRRIAGVSSFGFTGTNVHVVLESAASAGLKNDAAARAARHADRPLHVLRLSARDEIALDALTARWIEFLAESTERFSDICFTAATGRADLPERAAIVAADAADAVAKLRSLHSSEPAPGVARGVAVDRSRAATAFLFSGHGSQYPGMARELYETQPTFRAALEECDARLRGVIERPLLSVLYPTAPDAAADALLLEGMTYSQPALFAIEYALAMLWRSWGVQPAAVLGHSIGEYAAACVAGVFSLDDGLKLVGARGRLMDALPQRGAMLAVFAPTAAVEPLVAAHGGRVSIAAINGPAEVVLSGETAAVDAIAEALTARGTEIRRLAVAQAGHSHLLDPILDEFEAVAAAVRFAAPVLPLISCTTGREATAAELCDPRYWRRHFRDAVRFSDALRTLHQQGCTLFLEVGPHTALAAMGGRCMADSGAVFVPSLRRDRSDWQQMLESLVALYASGVRVDWMGFERDYLETRDGVRRRVAAPTYAWTRRRYWLEHAVSPAGADPCAARASRTPTHVWDSVLAAGRSQEIQGPLDLALNSFPQRWTALSRLTTAMIAVTLRDLGAFSETLPRTAAEAARAAGILPRFDRLVARWVGRLESEALLRPSGNGYVVAPELSGLSTEAGWREAEERSGDWPFILDYLQRCEAMLPAILTGRANPLETLFPGGSFDIAEQLYRDSAMPRYYNAVAGAVVSTFAQSGGQVRLLEVGGGTAGTTGALLPVIERTGGTYHFTDVSELFLARAAEQFRASDCISFGLLDVDRDPISQGYAAAGFDVIVAANVIHAAADIPLTLQRMGSLLAPGGLLILIEVTTYLDWFDVSTALLEGWDRQDDALRPDHPMLSADAWLGAMRDAGFVEAAALPGTGSPAGVMAQHVLVAQSPAAAQQDTAAGAVFAPATGSARDAAAHRAGAEQAANDFAARIARAAAHERRDLLAGFVRHHIAALLRLDTPDQIQRQARLLELGLDSLMAVELRGRLSRGLPLAEPLPATLIFDHPTVEAIVALIERVLEPAARSAPAATAQDDRHQLAAPHAGDDIDALSDEEVEARLIERLERIEGRAQ
jgi:acyl transferase domain-containing protein/SAM-dependent methyltransferase/aryl carrier-like protein